MDNSSSPLDTLRQLKEMLDAGALTPTEFEALKQRLVFNQSAAAATPPPQPPLAPTPTPTPPATDFVAPAPPAAVPPAPTPPAPVVPADMPPGPWVPVVVPNAAPQPSAFTELRPPNVRPENVSSVPPAVRPVPVAPLGTAAPAAGSVSDAYQAPRVVPQPMIVPPPPVASPPVAPPPSFSVPPVPEPQVEPNSGWVADEFPESETPAARSPLALILSIGGLLALLGLVVYLALNRPPSERISSTSLTAADSVAAPIETGPQVEQVQAPVALPETVRVRPANPAPALPARPRSAPQAQDSVTSSPAAAPDSVSPD